MSALSDQADLLDLDLNPPVFRSARRWPVHVLAGLTALIVCMTVAGISAKRLSDVKPLPAWAQAPMPDSTGVPQADQEPGRPTVPLSAPPPGSTPAPPDPRITWPFARSAQQRTVTAADGLPADWADDGQACSIGCPPAGAIPGWPLKPFHAQHALRNGFNELRGDSFHHGIDIQARDGSSVYAIQPGYAHIIQSAGADERVQVGNFIYWHVKIQVAEGQQIVPYQTVLGHTFYGYGHLHLSEVDAAGDYLNPLRPQGRSLSPWSDTATPVIGRPVIAADGTARIRAFDPQSFHLRTTYLTPVIAPVAIAWRLFDADGRRVGPLQWAYRGTQNYPWADNQAVFAPDAHDAGFDCFFSRLVCKPDWDFVLAGGLAPAITPPASGHFRLSVYVWGAGGVAAARDTWIEQTDSGIKQLFPAQAGR